MLEKLKVWIEERRRKRSDAALANYVAQRQRYALEWDEREFRVVEVGIECRVVLRVEWKGIKKITALKQDCWSVDHVLMIVGNEGGAFQLDEDMAQFWEFQHELPEHLPGAMGRAEFWNRVVQPPFETCLTTVYEAQRT